MGQDQHPPRDRGAHCRKYRREAVPTVSTLTEPFQRGTGRIRNDHAGVGLGLAIVKSITQVHDGSLTVVPRSAGGLRIVVQLPTPPSHAAE
ncbi:ATP-binding protein [Streptosporangium sp. 'caverna']|uniref:ATP-binding protein n=1 Tax=Streptosporangium sp. 'caverna' TaxID=2202249 RepID=UPI00272C8892|nr:ATP-binding protein [Streptosporangium sp. 'caverna']